MALNRKKRKAAAARFLVDAAKAHPSASRKKEVAARLAAARN
jgi:hypothetical protein